jgi:molybdopterin biosynthesis enzyme
MVTFYEFVRDALLKLSGVAPVEPLPRFRVPCVTPLKKRPGRSEFQRGILFRENGEWKVRATGVAGLGRAALDVRGELHHRRRARARQRRARRSGLGAALRGAG